MANPQTKTIKRLFAVASNLCAFPKCSNSIVDAVSGKITGKICHIKGNRPGSKRFDPNQNDEERHGFQNLILLCPIHHDVIDDDEIAYTVQRLQAMKVAHEQSAAQATSELSDDAARQLVLNLENTSIQDGSILVSTNQIGGQIAHSIVNVGPRPRSIDENSRLAIAKRLYPLPPHDYEIDTNHNDADGSNLAYQLTQILNAANWKCLASSVSMLPRPRMGIRISYPVRTPAVREFISCLEQCGFSPTRLSAIVGR